MNVTRWKDQCWLTVPSAYYKIKVISSFGCALITGINICTEHSRTNRTAVIEIQATIIITRN